jgi:DNA replication protein DnaC
MDITPTNQQNQAIKAIVDWYASDQMEFYLAGYAGVGKSTIVQFATTAINFINNATKRNGQ